MSNAENYKENLIKPMPSSSNLNDSKRKSTKKAKLSIPFKKLRKALCCCLDLMKMKEFYAKIKINTIRWTTPHCLGHSKPRMTSTIFWRA